MQKLDWWSKPFIAVAIGYSIYDLFHALRLGRIAALFSPNLLMIKKSKQPLNFYVHVLFRLIFISVLILAIIFL